MGRLYHLPSSQAARGPSGDPILMHALVAQSRLTAFKGAQCEDGEVGGLGEELERI